MTYILLKLAKEIGILLIIGNAYYTGNTNWTKCILLFKIDAIYEQFFKIEKNCWAIKVKI